MKEGLIIEDKLKVCRAKLEQTYTRIKTIQEELYEDYYEYKFIRTSTMNKLENLITSIELCVNNSESHGEHV